MSMKLPRSISRMTQWFARDRKARRVACSAIIAAAIVLDVESAVAQHGPDPSTVDLLHTPATPMTVQKSVNPAAINPGDLVFVDVFRRPEVSTTTPVDANGFISLPFVGNVSIAGMSEADAALRVSQALSGILRNPKVTVSRSGPVFSGGYRTAEMKTEILPLMNANASGLSETLRGMTTEGGTISFDANTNSLIITDTPGAVQNMLAVIRQLDEMQTQLTQVRIESKIAEVKIGALKELGVRWFVQGDELNGGYYPLGNQSVGLNTYKGQSASPINNEMLSNNNGNNSALSGLTRRFVNEPNFDRMLNLPVQVPKTGQMFLGLLNNGIDLGLLIDALVADDKAELLANPNILTVNHKSAEIEMIDEFPYTEFGTEVSGRANFSTRFLDLGIQMVVTPHVLQDKSGAYVKLEFEPEVSSPVGQNNGVPIRSVRRYKGESNVRDGQTLVVGGIYRNDVRNIEQRVPGLGSIPVVGNLFKRKEKTREQTELMIFLTPTIHQNPESVTWDHMLDLTAKSETLGPAIRGEKPQDAEPAEASRRQ